MSFLENIIWCKIIYIFGRNVLLLAFITKGEKFENNIYFKYQKETSHKFKSYISWEISWLERFYVCMYMYMRANEKVLHTILMVICVYEVHKRVMRVPLEPLSATPENQNSKIFSTTGLIFDLKVSFNLSDLNFSLWGRGDF